MRNDGLTPLHPCMSTGPLEEYNIKYNIDYNITTANLQVLRSTAFRVYII